MGPPRDDVTILETRGTGLTPGVATCRLKAALASVKQWRKDGADTPARRRSPLGSGLLPALTTLGSSPSPHLTQGPFRTWLGAAVVAS